MQTRLVQAAPKQRRLHPCRVAAGASLALAAAAAAAAYARGGLPLRTPGGGLAAQTRHEADAQILAEGRGLASDTSVSSPGEARRAQAQFELKQANASCSNYRQIEMETQPATHASENECARRCQAHPGCVGFGFQPHACFQEGKGNWQGACRMWSGDCQAQENDCWNDYSLTSPTLIDFEFVAENTGCSNWRDITIGEKLVLPSETACAAKCARTDGCTSFGFQPRDCSSPDQKPFDRQACYLFFGTCEQDRSDCWNHYELKQVGSPDTVASAATEPADAAAASTPAAAPAADSAESAESSAAGAEAGEDYNQHLQELAGQKAA